MTARNSMRTSPSTFHSIPPFIERVKNSCVSLGTQVFQIGQKVIWKPSAA